MSARLFQGLHALLAAGWPTHSLFLNTQQTTPLSNSAWNNNWSTSQAKAQHELRGNASLEDSFKQIHVDGQQVLKKLEGIASGLNKLAHGALPVLLVGSSSSRRPSFALAPVLWNSSLCFRFSSCFHLIFLYRRSLRARPASQGRTRQCLPWARGRPLCPRPVPSTCRRHPPTTKIHLAKGHPGGESSCRARAAGPAAPQPAGHTSNGARCHSLRRDLCPRLTPRLQVMRNVSSPASREYRLVQSEQAGLLKRGPAFLGAALSNKRTKVRPLFLGLSPSLFGIDMFPRSKHLARSSRSPSATTRRPGSSVS